MREIKFRGQVRSDKLWEFGSLWIDNDEYCIKGTDREWWKVIPETVGQFTGLYDKNGKEIYEGDVVRDIYDSIFAITFGTFTDTKGHDQVGFYKTYFSIDEDLNVCNGTMDDVDKTCEVIGNIHEGVME